PSLDLKFVEIPDSACINGVLKLPSDVIADGVERLKAAAVAQFAGTPPPFRVINVVVNRIWGYEGQVIVSRYLDNCFLFEFNSIRLCDWVLSRSWHIHNTSMLLRRWEKGIQPLDLSAKNSPERITLKNVPLGVISIKGISWISSLLGKPWKKFVREGLDVKVCVLRDRAVVCPETVMIELDDGELCKVEVVQTKAREYKSNVNKKWGHKENVQKEWRRVDTSKQVVVVRSPRENQMVMVGNSEMGGAVEIHSTPEGMASRSGPEGKEISTKISKTEKRRNSMKKGRLRREL
ncbi:hypothetical protein LINPERPRIM_LOCUS37895, partial [Linum perenne]